MRPIVYPYRMGSGSAKVLAHGLGCRRVWPDRNYRPRRNHMVINWGNSKWPHWYFGNAVTMLNKPPFVERAANKLLTLDKLAEQGVSIPRYTTDAHEAYEWETGVMVRQTLTGHSGRGCLYVDESDRTLLLGSLQGAPLYTEYIKKAGEYRVHVALTRGANGDRLEPIDYQQKKLRSGSEGNNFQIRSHENGWIFCRESIEVRPRAQELAIRAVKALGLDFGAVDIIHNEYRREYYVLEVNTAPGLEGTTLNSYLNAFRSLL